jgi:nucleoside-diphosphate-sugar epimerase
LLCSRLLGPIRPFWFSMAKTFPPQGCCAAWARAWGHPARLLPVPARWLKLAATMMGKPDVAQRLCGSLQVDIEKTRRLLGWTPPLAQDEGLRRAAGMQKP